MTFEIDDPVSVHCEYQLYFGFHSSSSMVHVQVHNIRSSTLSRVLDEHCVLVCASFISFFEGGLLFALSCQIERNTQ